MTSSKPNISDPIRDSDNGAPSHTPTPSRRTVDDVWREIVAGKKITVKEMKEEPDVMMTLEDFLVKKGAVDEGTVVEEKEVKYRPQERMSSGGVHALDYSRRATSLQIAEKVEGGIVEFRSGSLGVGVGGGRGKRGRAAVLESLDKAAERRQRRMIKNRESAARSRERKQAYQVELESLAVRLEEEQEELLKEKNERTKKRFKQLMELVIPVLEKRRPSRSLRRVQSLQW